MRKRSLSGYLITKAGLVLTQREVVMGRQLLPPNTGPNVVGPWVGIAMGRRRSFPIRVVATGDFQGADITIEELVAGVPANISLYGNNNLPIGQRVDTGVPKIVGVINPPTAGGQSNDLVTEYPTSEWIRASTGAFTGGNAGIVEVETLE